MVENKKLPRVLIIDDELLQRKIVGQQLLELGFSSESVASAAEGIDLLQREPNWGREITTQIETRTTICPFCALSAMDTTCVREYCSRCLGEVYYSIMYSL